MTEDEFWAALAPLPPAEEIVYRLYYDDKGYPVQFTTEDLPGNYIEVDRETFISTPAHIRVVNGKLKIIQTVIYPKLVPSEYGKPCLPEDVCIIAREIDPQVKWSLKTYETD